ncbi:MAG: oligoendopeptidase F, partial [Hyphomicrobiales bacterium]
MNQQARTPANGVNPLKTAANIESASRSAAEPQAAEKVNALGDLPSWDLSDLYASPEDEQIFADLDEAESSAKRFIDAYAGKLTGLAAGDADALAESVRIYEALGDALGKIGSYARLLYEADGSSPVHAKFLGDIQERLNTIGSGLLFYELELNQISDDELA